MSVKEDWKQTGKNTGKAFGNLGKALGQTAKSIFTDDKKDENGESKLKNAWKDTGKGFGEAGKSFGHATKDTAKAAFDDDDSKDIKKDEAVDAEFEETKKEEK